ncbi:MAG: inositol monophosphatase, partial [Vicinamibacteria bacterium]|nr:inositol monophosphatase [Vicinamibacteria bacterium]
MSWRYLAAATEAALKAGAIQKERFRQKIQIDLKGEIDLVTEVDRACEQAILATLHEWFPEHDIVAEESGIKRTGAREVWYVDPLDGTTNYAHGFPCFAPSIALTIDGEVVAGAVYDPLREELYTAERGAGAHRNGRRLSVSATSELGDSL